MEIRKDDLSGEDIQALLREHLADAYRNSPPESVFALDVNALRGPNISFWSVREQGLLMGCGALKHLNKNHGEIKSMRTTAAALRRGVGSRMLDHIINEARIREYSRLSLETGSNAAYAPARALYAKFGFEECGPFADYSENEFSIFMSLAL